MTQTDNMVKPMKLFAYFGVPIGLVLLVAGISMAQQQSEVPEMLGLKGIVKVGIYKDLNRWRKFKLGTAYYVNPALAKKAQIMYVYSPDAILASGMAHAAYGLVLDGRVAFAQVQPEGTYHVMSPEGAVNMGLINAKNPLVFEGSLRDLKWLEGHGVTVVGFQKDFLNVEHGKPIVSWAPVKWEPSEDWKIWSSKLKKNYKAVPKEESKN